VKKVELRELQESIREREKELSIEGNKIYREIVKYLKESDLSIEDQELLRRNFVVKIVDGEKKGERLAEIISTDCKTACAEEIEYLKMIRKREKGLVKAYTFFACAGFLLLLYLATKVIALGDGFAHCEVTVGQLIIFLLAPVASVFYMTSIAPKGKKEQGPKKTGSSFGEQMRETMFTIMGLIILILALKSFPQVVFTCHIIVLILLTLACFVAFGVFAKLAINLE